MVLFQEGLLDLDKINLQRDREYTWCVNYNGLHVLDIVFQICTTRVCANWGSVILMSCAMVHMDQRSDTL